MNILSYHENLQRGTPDFPLALYIINSSNPKYHMQMHWHKEFEIIRIKKGVLELKLNENQIRLCGGQSIVIPGGIIHGGEPIDCEYECIVFSPGILYSIQKCRSLIKAHIQQPVIYKENADIDFMFDIMSDKPCGYELSVMGKLYIIAADIAKNNAACAVAPNEKIERIKAAISMIEENFGTKITLDELASICRMSPNYFSRYFKEITGQTPFEYITLHRIEAACEMLLSESKTITDVCYSCGFNDLSYFIHIFKRCKGMSPGAYVKTYSKN